MSKNPDEMYPIEAKKIANACAAKHKSNIDAGVTEWLRRVKKLPGFELWAISLVEMAGRTMIQDSRHAVAQAMRKASGHYGGPAKVVPGAEIARLFVQSYFDYPIDGRRLGDIKFEELPGIIADQQGKANGIMFNVRLCQALYNKQPKKGGALTVEGVLKEKSVGRLFTSLRQDEDVD